MRPRARHLETRDLRPRRRRRRGGERTKPPRLIDGRGGTNRGRARASLPPRTPELTRVPSLLFRSAEPLARKVQARKAGAFPRAIYRSMIYPQNDRGPPADALFPPSLPPPLSLSPQSSPRRPSRRRRRPPRRSSPPRSSPSPRRRSPRSPWCARDPHARPRAPPIVPVVDPSARDRSIDRSIDRSCFFSPSARRARSSPAALLSRSPPLSQTPSSSRLTSASTATAPASSSASTTSSSASSSSPSPRSSSRSFTPRRRTKASRRAARTTTPVSPSEQAALGLSRWTTCAVRCLRREENERCAGVVVASAVG